MARITITTDYCEVVDWFDITGGDLESPMARASFLCDLQDTLRVAAKREEEQEAEEGKAI